MRKVLCVCLALVLCLFATGYAETVKRNWLEMNGTIEDGAYRNELLGLGFDMDGWSLYPAEWELSEEEQDYDEIPADVTDAETEMHEYFMIRAFQAFKSDDSDVEILIQHIGENEAKNAEKDIENIVYGLMDNQIKYSRLNPQVEYTTTKIGDRDYPGFTTYTEHDGVRRYTRSVVFVQDEYLAIIFTASVSEDKTEEIFQHFYHLKDSEE